jgi:hypothetical protein
MAAQRVRGQHYRRRVAPEGRFLSSATIELFEQYGFSRSRQVGKRAWIVSRQVDERPPLRPADQAAAAARLVRPSRQVVASIVSCIWGDRARATADFRIGGIAATRLDARLADAVLCVDTIRFAQNMGTSR